MNYKELIKEINIAVAGLSQREAWEIKSILPDKL